MPSEIGVSSEMLGVIKPPGPTRLDALSSGPWLGQAQSSFP